MKKIFIRLSVLMNVVVVLIVLFLFFRLGGFVYFENRIAKTLSNDENVMPIIKIRNENLQLVGENHKDVVFVGDSHTNYFEWSEYFNDLSIANRGIGSDTSEGIIQRINQINDLKPEKVFIMVGINDIQQGVPIDVISTNINRIIKALNKENPRIEIYIQSVLPVSDDLYERNFYKDSNPINESVSDLNDLLSRVSGATYVEIAGNLGDVLPEEYTVDGIHLNKEGYKIWLSQVERYINR